MCPLMMIAVHVRECIITVSSSVVVWRLMRLISISVCALSIMMIVASRLLLLLLMMVVRLVMAVAIVMRRTMPISPTSATTTTTPVVMSGIVGRRSVRMVVVLLVMVSVHFLLWHALFRLAPFAVYLVKSF